MFGSGVSRRSGRNLLDEPVLTVGPEMCLSREDRLGMEARVGVAHSDGYKQTAASAPDAGLLVLVLVLWRLAHTKIHLYAIYPSSLPDSSSPASWPDSTKLLCQQRALMLVCFAPT